MPPAKGPGSGRRNPSVLVTDSREQQPARRNPASTRFITVDNVLQYASDVPSAQQRLPPPGARQRPRSRLASGGGLIGSGAGGGMGSSSTTGTMGRLAAQPRLPPRTTKVSEKLVLLPETDQVTQEEEEEEEVDEEAVRRLAEERNLDPEIVRRQLALGRQQGDFDVDNELAPLLAEEEFKKRRRVPPERAKSYAERLPKARRAEKLARVTAYCTAQAYKMSSTAAFLKEWHGARTKLYDDCLYVAYQLPLLPGRGGYRVKSSAALKTAGGKAVLDEEIERNERRDYHEEYFTEEAEHSVGGGRLDQGSRHSHESTESEQEHGEHHLEDADGRNIHDQDHRSTSQAPAKISPSVLAVAEMFVFSYGVVVFWNFTERQEKDVLADLAFSHSSTTGEPLLLATVPLQEEDFETEEFHFEYSTEISRPRVYNDMITLRSGDHMIKLAISHGISQSTKLCFFEEVMARQMSEAKDVPRRLATTGTLGMKREEVFRILGRLFKSRVEVNLSSNMLDVPNFFWESEPTLYPLYIAVREYLEIKPRIQVLNERCRVFLDLAEILSDSIADNKESHQTWIIIVLIIISIFVTISEVVLRFGLLHARSGPASAGPSLFSTVFGSRGCTCPVVNSTAAIGSSFPQGLLEYTAS
ncbi:yagE family protein [Paecilomyces variotii No. 5]|uniref:YagE family protein n=1 Tax=Byssochlamys spectabilis (strain No. 5 / NBRC 109023) TaxID=1356009 RepID=V5I562_BYSSN|nr:yagE family protein [Paecilomyces variotii No. 5]